MILSERQAVNRLLPPKCDPFTGPPIGSVEEWYAGLRAAGPLLRGRVGAAAVRRIRPDTTRATLCCFSLCRTAAISPSICPKDLASADAAVRALRAAFAELLDARPREDTRDICWEIGVAINRGLVSRDEAVDNAIFLMFAGLETSVNMIAAGCAALAAAPDQFAVLRGDPGLARSAVEEFLRYDAPTPNHRPHGHGTDRHRRPDHQQGTRASAHARFGES
jgi:hypothetical protein